MPSSFETEFDSAAMDDLYSSFGLSATYTPPNTNATTALTVRVHREDYREETDDRMQVRAAQHGMVFVRQSELSNPVKGGRFKVESAEVWTIELPPVLKNGQFHCTCMRTGAERMTGREAANA